MTAYEAFREETCEALGLNNGAKTATLAEAHNVFKKWLGQDYDTDALDAMLATAAVQKLDGDVVWLLIISGSGNAKLKPYRHSAA